MSSQLTILHYNDVYNVDATSTREPIGGAARFLTAVKSFSHLDPLILFSGDAFSPSMRKCLISSSIICVLCVFCPIYPMTPANDFLCIIPLCTQSVSTFTKGEQMIPVLDKIGTHCAVLGNHDFGSYEQIYYDFKECKLCANIT